MPIPNLTGGAALGGTSDARGGTNITLGTSFTAISGNGMTLAKWLTLAAAAALLWYAWRRYA